MKTNFLHKKGWYPHTINIETKDNRFKYVITVSLYYSIGTGEMHFNSKSMVLKAQYYKCGREFQYYTIIGLTKYVSNKHSS